MTACADGPSGPRRPPCARTGVTVPSERRRRRSAIWPSPSCGISSCGLVRGSRRGPICGSPGGRLGIAGGFGAGGALALVFATDVHALFLAAPIIAYAVNSLFKGVARLLGPSKEFRAVPVAIVPWGIVIDPDRQPAPVDWP